MKNSQALKVMIEGQELVDFLGFCFRMQDGAFQVLLGGKWRNFDSPGGPPGTVPEYLLRNGAEIFPGA